MNNEILEKIVVNFLHHKQDYSVEEATNIYYANAVHFKAVSDCLGQAFAEALLTKITRKKK